MRRFAAGAALAAAFAGAAPAGAIIHPDGLGRVPSAALVTAALSPRTELRCGGTVRDALHVITAAHCTYDRAGRALPAGKLSVVAGITRAEAPEATAQQRAVVAVSTDPAFARHGATALHDDAILTLDEPLDLQPGVVGALPLAAAGAPATGGTFSGWGRTHPRRPGGVLHFADVDVLHARSCSHFGLRFDAAVMLCAGRMDADGATTGGCNGDSGGALVEDARLVGIASFTGPRECGDRRFPTVFVRVGAPAVNAFLRQPDPPARPSFASRPHVVGASTSTGAALRCRPGRATDGTSISYAFARAPVLGGTAERRWATPVTPSSPSATYRLTGTELAAAVFCVARATSTGGSVAATSTNGVGLAGSVPIL